MFSAIQLKTINRYQQDIRCDQLKELKLVNISKNELHNLNMQQDLDFTKRYCNSIINKTDEHTGLLRNVSKQNKKDLVIA